MFSYNIYGLKHDKLGTNSKDCLIRAKMKLTQLSNFLSKNATIVTPN